MACPGCGTEEFPSAKFCPRCGQPRQMVCPACAAPAVGTDAAFCGECGASMRHPAAGGAATSPAVAPGAITETNKPAVERRVCSVLFADLVGFTPLSESRDPEEVRELLSRYFDVARTVVGRYGGVIEKFIGDAVMAVWGTPVATEGDAERAVRAALELVDSVTALGVETGIAGLSARAGVVTGDVAVTLAAVGEGMVAGDAVNTAARVQAAAEPASVLTDGATRRLAAGGIGFDDAGEHLLKGKAEPEHLWRATRVHAGVGGAQRVDGLEAALVGRDAELRLIKELFHAAADRRTPRLVVVAGAAGVGKSRLGWEFEKYVDGLKQVMAWHRGRCLSYGEGVAFWGLAEAVRQRLGIAEEDPTDVAAVKLAVQLPDIVPDPAERAYVGVRIGRLLGLSAAGDDGAELARDELFAGWRMFFERLAAVDPVILLIEDAQYADAGLLDFIDHLVDWVRDLPIYVLVLARQELEQRRPGFGVGRNRTVLAVDPLDSASMDALVDALVPGMPATARAAITSHAQGVPLFAVETVRSLVDRDIVSPVDGVYRLVGDVGELSVPDSLHGLLAARLDALAGPARALVADAAVLGVSFPAEALVAVSDQPEDAVRTGLAELLRREVLEVSADPLSPQRGEYRFTQQLLRQVAYDTLSRRDRKLRHLAVATQLRKVFAEDGEEVADAIARHYRDALAAVPDDDDAPQLRGEAVRMFVRAAERAQRAGAPNVAATSYATAAELAAPDEPDVAAELWEQAAGAAIVGSDHEGGLRYAEEARVLHLAGGRDRAAARAQMLMGRAFGVIGKLTAAHDHLTSALEVLRADPDVDTVAVLWQLATVAAFGGGPQSEADRLSAEALELGQALDVGDRMLAELLITRAYAHVVANRTTQAAASMDYAAKLAERAGDSHVRAKALLNLSDALAGFDPPAAAAAASTAIEQARRVGARGQLAVAVANLVEVKLSTGAWDDADQDLAAALDGDEFGQQFLHYHRVKLAALRGDPATVTAIMAALPQRFRDSEDPQDRAAVALAEAFAADVSGDDAAALARARSVLIDLAGIGIRAEQVRWAWALAARAAHRLGDAAAERELVEILDEHPIGHLCPLLRSERDLARARLATDPHAVAVLFDAAIEGLRRLPSPYHLAHALLDRAEWLAAAGDDAAAEPDVAEAGEIAARLRAVPLATRVATFDRVLT